MHATVTPWRWLSRALMLACVVVGLAAMHTMGHAGMRHGSQTMAQVRLMTEAVSDAQSMSGSGDELGLAAAPAGGHAADMWAVCVAVLGGATLLLLFRAAMARSLRPAIRGLSRAIGVLFAPRAPPPRLGLRLADLSVVRR